ncbi:hypothetical protein GO009_06720 [Muricauda sp. TY007]|uniref:hypothetical protein n=1 Tax=Allomuricauda sp. TY007 TaxID=2683200 RepID=UPI0013BFBC10|nr:hypothetical protein [Muricauda sp. TY007]NDV15715.1 hypothetical protein [Muricauda sp. TY007]
MTKFKYENQGGRGFSVFHPFSKNKPEKQAKKEKEITKTDLLFNGIKREKSLKFKRWNREDLSYKKVKMGQAVKILNCVVHPSSNIYPIIKEMKSNRSLFDRVKRMTKSNYVHISSAAVKITIEQNIATIVKSSL